MASSDRRYAVDSNFAIAALDAANEFHAIATQARAGRVLALAGHAAFETYSVLTRLPEPRRLAPEVVAELLRIDFPEFCPLSARGTNRMIARAAELNISGGAIYDALVAAAALENDRILLSFDRRAEPTYQKVGVTYELLGG